MSLKALEPFSLVGGTALTLRYGHRKSVDLDLFSSTSFDPDIIVKKLVDAFGQDYSTESKTAKWGIFCFIQGIKVDLIKHPHPLLEEIQVTQNIRMFSDADIISMKLNAILGRGVKKDFWDIDELLKHYSLKMMIEFYERKYPEQNLLITIPQALIYFDDAEESEDPISLKGQTWEAVKKSIQKHVREFLK